MEKGIVSERDRVNILLVDDHPENLVTLSAILTHPDYNIVTVLSGRQALSALLRDEFSVVVLDVMMPGMDGFQLASLMKGRECTQSIPIIFLTAIATDVELIYKGYSVGAVDYLMKPIEPEIVRAKVAVFAELFRSKQRVKQQAETLIKIERKAQEARLAFQRQEKAWYSTTLKSIGDAVIATDIHGIVRFINPLAESLTGWTHADAHGKPLEEVFKLLHEETRKKVESPAAKVMRDCELVGLEDHTLLVSKDGREYILEDSGAPITDEKGTILGVVIVFRDGTENRREAQRRSFVSKASSILLSSLDYSSTLENVARLAVSSIADCCIVHVVSEAGTVEQIAQAPVDPGASYLVHRVISAGKTEFISDLSDLHLKSLGFKSCICVPFTMHGNHLGAVTFLLGRSRPDYCAKDVQMVEELAIRAATAIENSRLYDEAKQAIRLRDEFLLIASHELRTPVTALKLQLQTLKSLVSKKMIVNYPSEKIDQMFGISDRQLARFQKLIEELLDVSRIGAGHLKLEKEQVDMAEVVREVVSQFAGEVQKTSCHIEVEAVPAIGEWDRLRVEQVVINLLANSMKYGAGTPIKVTIENGGSVAWLKVQDHGPGITKDDQLRIFDRFERAVSARYFPGLGLGLYISKQIVEAHGGKIGVKSEPGLGATFTVELPLKLEKVEKRVA